MADAARDRKDLSHRFYSPCQLDDQSVELQALVDEARAGSSDAHGQLLNDLRPKMVAYFSRRLSRKLAQKASEQDLAQEASLFAFRKFEQFSGATLAKYSGWLMGICRNVLRHLERMFGPGSDRDLSREELLDELRLAMESQRPFLRRRQAAPDVVAALESAGQLKAALATLLEDERQIITLHHQENLTFTAIACRLALTIDSVRRSYKRAVAKLRLRMA